MFIKFGTTFIPVSSVELLEVHGSTVKVTTRITSLVKTFNSPEVALEFVEACCGSYVTTLTSVSGDEGVFICTKGTDGEDSEHETQDFSN